MLLENTSRRAIEAVFTGKLSFCKFLAANDTGETGAHQSGIYIPKPAVSIIFSGQFDRGSNQDRYATIHWSDGTSTNNRFIYYGSGTRNEYRITQFGKGFEYLHPDHTGDLFVLVKNDEENYQGFFLSTDEEIDEFLSAFSLSPSDTGKLIYRENEPTPTTELSEFEKFFALLNKEFPSTFVMSEKARNIDLMLNNHENEIFSDPDKKIITWTEVEYRLFRYIEHAFYSKTYEKGFPSLDDFVVAANSVLNRRKSRAGKSLEHHLSFIFSRNNLQFSEQPTTEGKNKPDFLFPGINYYWDQSFPRNKLYFLAAKTTCKDRWRQIISEADQISVKHLFTLQQGISSQQLQEMEKYNVVLVVPKSNLSTFPENSRSKILTLHGFLSLIKR